MTDAPITQVSEVISRVICAITLCPVVVIAVAGASGSPPLCVFRCDLIITLLPRDMSDVGAAGGNVASSTPLARSQLSIARTLLLTLHVLRILVNCHYMALFVLTRGGSPDVCVITRVCTCVLCLGDGNCGFVCCYTLMCVPLSCGPGLGMWRMVGSALVLGI